MDYVVVCFAAFTASMLTFFSGFGLGTIMLPVFSIFFPIDLAIALSGVVHFFNNLFKLFLVGRHADRLTLLWFGIPAVVAAFAGAWVMIHLADFQPLSSYDLQGQSFTVTPVKLVVAVLLLFFALADLLPGLKNISFSRWVLPLGGVLSGFFGGLSGHQGALRSAFLVKSGLSKEAFIGSSVVISCFIDFTRLSVYASRFSGAGLDGKMGLVVSATLSAISGAYIGSKLLKKVTLSLIQMFVAVFLVLMAVGLAAGFI